MVQFCLCQNFYLFSSWIFGGCDCIFRSFLPNEQSSGLVLVLIPLQPFPFFHIKESTWVTLCALCTFELGFQGEAEHTEFDLFLFWIWYLSHIHMVFIQLNIFSWRNSKRNRIVYIDLSALRFNKKEWLAVWVHKIWLIMWDYSCIESNPQRGIHPFLFNFKLFNVVWIASS